MAMNNAPPSCPSCLETTGGVLPCPHCGWSGKTEPDSPLFLPLGTQLRERYRLAQVLGHGGFGITYLAWDELLTEKVAIKEFLPRDVAGRGLDRRSVFAHSGEALEAFRSGLAGFLKEAHTLARFDENPYVISVRDYFEANNTAYLVMPYLEGMTLHSYIEQKGGRLAYAAVEGVLICVLDGLRPLHGAGVLHRDISPDNIYLTTEQQVKLIDFGSARHIIGSRSLTAVCKAGYSPEEQYRRGGKEGPWTDIYSVAATGYWALTGQPPPDALDRLVEDPVVPPSRLGVQLPPAAERALLKALAVRTPERFQSVEAFQQALRSPKEPWLRGWRAWLTGGIAGCTLLLLLVVFLDPLAIFTTPKAPEVAVLAPPGVPNEVIAAFERLKESRQAAIEAGADQPPVPREYEAAEVHRDKANSAYKAGDYVATLPELRAAVEDYQAASTIIRERTRERFLRPAIEARERTQAARQAADDAGVTADNAYYREGQRHAQEGENALSEEDTDSAINAFRAATLAFELAHKAFQRKIDEDRQRAASDRYRLETARKKEEEFCNNVAFNKDKSALERYLQAEPQGLCWDDANRRHAELLREDRYAQLVIRSNASNDLVFINGELSGPTGPSPHRLRKGERYEISVEKEDYQPWTKTIEKLDQDMVLHAKLTKIPPQAIGGKETQSPKTSDRSLCTRLQTVSEVRIPDLRSYLAKFPSGFCSGWARDRVESLKKVATIQSQCNDLRGDVPPLCLSTGYGCLNGNCQNGFGIKRYENGNCYWGEWVNGVRSGDGGRYIPGANGEADVYYGRVRDGKVISGVYAHESGNCFVGRTDPETRRRVRGALVFPDGGISIIGNP